MTPGISGLKSFFGWMRSHWVWAIIILLILVPLVLLPLLLKGTALLAKVPVLGSLMAKLPAIGGASA